MSTDPAPRYLEPSGLTTKVFNKAVQALTRAGISVMGSRVLAVRGRKSGEWRTTPVNLLTVDGDTYLVAPRGQTQWVRNMRVARGGELRRGRRVQRFTAVELAYAEKPPELRADLKRSSWEFGIFFENITAESTDEQLLG